MKSEKLTKRWLSSGILIEILIALYPGLTQADAEAKFKQVSEAYEVLSDKNKRMAYDQHGSNYFQSQNAPKFTDANDIFKQFFSSFGDDDSPFSAFGGMPGMGASFGARPGNFGMPGMNASFGMGGMPGMNAGFGMGGMPGMGGFSGFHNNQTSRDVVAPAEIKLQLTLQDLYTGVEKRLKVKRKLLSGNYAEKVLTINVKPGWKAGTKIKFPNEGDELPNGTQDLEFVIEEKPHAVFVRNGNNLTAAISVSIVEALCGFTRNITLLDGSVFPVSSSKPSQPGSSLIYKDKGMPVSKFPGTKGDLFVTVNVQFPETISEQQKKILKSTFL